MSGIRVAVALALVGAVWTAGCIFSPEKGGPGNPARAYSEDLSHPDSLLNDLQASYERKEIEPYANLLASEFKFLFQTEDVTPDIPLGFWNRDEDSTGTRNLFEAPDVLKMEIDLLKVDEDTDYILEGNVVTRIIVQTTLSVPTVGDITYFVNGDQHYFYFREGAEEDGEDPERWYIVQWEDIGQGGSVGAPDRQFQPLATDAAGRRLVQTTLGELRRRAAAGS